MPKSKSTKKSKIRHQPLGQVITEDLKSSKYAKTKIKSSQPSSGNESDDDNDDDGYMDEKTSARIYNMSREQQEEEEARAGNKGREAVFEDVEGKGWKKGGGRRKKYEDDDSSDEEEEVEEIEVDDEEYLKATVDKGYVSVGLGLTGDEEAAVAKMMGGGGERRTLADIIMDKINEKQNEIRDNMEGAEEEEEVNPFPEKVVTVYTDIGNILSRYTAGKLPKAFKVIPSLTEWEDILYLTRPDKWTPQAMFAATKIFASNLNPRMAQRFYNLVLLDAVRADILENKKLNYHYYQSLKKSLYKPAAFFKGILIPLCRTNCTLREAAIISSVLSKISVPVAHSAVALHKISTLEYTGGQAVFIRCLLNKKYSLPMPVVGSLVKYFTLPYTRSLEAKRTGVIMGKKEPLPVLWHQALLTFCERYKGCLTDKDKEGIKNTCKIEIHHQITKEVRRELFGAKGYRGEGMELE